MSLCSKLSLPGGQKDEQTGGRWAGLGRSSSSASAVWSAGGEAAAEWSPSPAPASPDHRPAPGKRKEAEKESSEGQKALRKGCEESQKSIDKDDCAHISGR